MAPNDFLRLPYLFDGEKLDRDLALCLSREWKEHFNPADYAGDWKIIALRSENGREDAITANDRARYQDTELLARCGYFTEILDGLACEKQSVRLMRLNPGSRIKEHRDHGLSYPDGVFRLHIPIRTNEGVAFYVNARSVPMRRGECWYADFDLPHRVENLGAEPRIHLVIDCLRNEWTDTLFTSLGYDPERAGEKKINPGDIPLIIRQLETMDTDRARALIAELRSLADTETAGASE